MKLLVSEDKLKTMLYIRSYYEHWPKNSNKEIDLVYLTIYFYIVVGTMFRYYYFYRKILTSILTVGVFFWYHYFCSDNL